MFEKVVRDKAGWDKIHEEYSGIKNLRDKLYEKLGCSKVTDTVPGWIYERTMGKIQSLKELYGDEGVESYASLHVLLHSTLPELEQVTTNDEESWQNLVVHSDFPGDDSVRKFYENLLAEISTA